MRLHNQILLSRLLTRSGDQAWDFALPVTLVVLFPQRFSLIATIFLATKLGQFLFQPIMASLIDRWKRNLTAYFGTVLQLVSVVAAAACIHSLLAAQSSSSAKFNFGIDGLLICGVVISSIFSTLGSGLMDIAVGNDWIPTLVEPDQLSTVNSRLKQIDLLTEVLSPVVAGVLLALSTQSNPLFGFQLVVLWNVISFGPEILILRRVFHRAQSLQQLPLSTSKFSGGLISKIVMGWREFWSHSSAAAMLAYAFLWLSALSPHGVLLTSFLKGGWEVSEVSLGIFRGAGAVFGLLATMTFPFVVRRLGVIRGSLAFIGLQAVTLLIAIPFFYNRALDGIVFLSLVLISRIGLYGFSLGEMEIRQRTIEAGQRGQVNGVASALTSFATLILYGAGTLVPEHAQFHWMVLLSAASVCIGAVVYYRWSRQRIEFGATL